MPEDVEKLFQRIAERAETREHPVIHIHGDVGHVLHIQQVQSLTLHAQGASIANLSGKVES